MPAKPRDLAQTLGDIALALPDVTQGIAYKGTALERSTFAVKKKSFLFLGGEELMVKLDASSPAAEKVAQKSPDCCKAGAHGWVTLKYRHDDAPVLKVLTTWIEESYQLFAQKTVAEKKARPKKRSSG